MSATRWAIGLAIAAVTAAQLTLLATDVASKNGPPDGRGKPERRPASIQLTPDPIAIQCDGVDASTITVQITDGQGRIVPDGTIVHFDARFGFVDPVEAATQRGEASTQLRMYASARNFPGDTGVDVFTDGLRASVGVDCAPAGPPCNPFSPPTDPASPPCSPLPCSTTDSPPIGTSPPCETPCSTTDSPPVGTSPPCPVVPANEIRIDVYPETVDIDSFGYFDVGAPLRVAVKLTQLSDTPYGGYQWAVEWPSEALSFEGDVFQIGPALGFATCADFSVSAPIDPSYDDARVGGCLSPGFGAASTYTGTLAEFTMSCNGAGIAKLRMIDSRLHNGYYTTLFGTNGALPVSTEGAIIDCLPAPCGPATSPPCETATQAPVCGPAFSPPCETPTPTPAPSLGCGTDGRPPATPVAGTPEYQLYLASSESAGIIRLVAGIVDLGGGPWIGAQWEICRSGAEAAFALARPLASQACSEQVDNGIRTLVACINVNLEPNVTFGDMWEVYYTCSSIGPVDLVLHAGSLGSIVFNSPADSGPAPVSLFNTRVDCTTTAPTITPTPTGFSPVVAEGTGTPTSRQRIAE